MSGTLEPKGLAVGQRLLAIDDSPDMGDLIAFVAEPLGYECMHAMTFAVAKEMLTDALDVIVVDLMMPDIDGIEVLRYLAQQRCTAGILLLSGADRRLLSVAEEMARASGLRVLGRLSKPFLPRDLAALLSTQAGVTAAQKRNRPDAPEITEADLRRAIAENELVVYYQPQVDIVSGVAVGAEVLVRWQRPSHGLVPPDAFVSAFEACGMTHDLTWAVVEQTFSDAALFEAGGWTPKLSINVSAMFLRDLDLPEKLFARAQAAGVSPANITIEIVESGAIEKVTAVLDIVTRLRLRGFHMSIDDFGTGFSMMQQLKRIPANELKVDKGFVLAMTHDADALVIVSKTIEIGHEMGMTVVAEGVETEEQLQKLRELKCDIAQGFLFAKAMPAAELLAWRAKTANGNYGAAQHPQ